MAEVSRLRRFIRYVDLDQGYNTNVSNGNRREHILARAVCIRYIAVATVINFSVAKSG